MTVETLDIITTLIKYIIGAMRGKIKNHFEQSLIINSPQTV